MSEPPSALRYTVGYALQPDKVHDLIQMSLVDYAKQHGIDVVRIDSDKPLIQQGPFNCIIHKLYTEDWKKQLDEYLAKNPKLVIVDPPELIEKLLHRDSMLDVVKRLKISLEKETIQIPKQVLVDQPEVFEGAEAIEKLGLKFPVIAKPLPVDGSAVSHELCLVFDHGGLRTLSTPILLQEFVNHGGVMFKVYVAGKQVTCVKRKSLPDMSEEKLRTLSGTMPFSHISNSSVRENGHNEEDVIANAEMPVESFIVELGKGLRQATGLNLFNVDLLRDAKDPSRYLLVDINYCPGFSKLPSYEPFFTNFLLDMVKNNTA